MNDPYNPCDAQGAKRNAAQWMMDANDRAHFFKKLDDLLEQPKSPMLRCHAAAPCTSIATKQSHLQAMDSVSCAQESSANEGVCDVSALSLSMSEDDDLDDASSSPPALSTSIVPLDLPEIPTVIPCDVPSNGHSKTSLSALHDDQPSQCQPCNQRHARANNAVTVNKKIFAGCKVVIVEAGHKMGKRRAQMLIIKFGGHIHQRVQKGTTHMVTSQERGQIPSHLSKEVLVVTAEWISDSVQDGCLHDTNRYHIADALPAPPKSSLSTPAVPNRVAAMEQAESIAIKKEHHQQDRIQSSEGFVPIFFGMQSPKMSQRMIKTELEDSNGMLHLPTSCPAIVPLPSPPNSVAASSPENQSANVHQMKEWFQSTEPFACQRGCKRKLNESETHEANLPPVLSAAETNQMVIEELTKLQKVYSDTGDHWRKYAYGKAIGVIRRLGDSPITAQSLPHLKGIGPKIAEKVQEILALGTSRKLKALENNEEVSALRQLGKIWGVGPATSKQLYAKGFHSIEALRRQPEVLTQQQQIGLKHFEEFLHRIPRTEVAQIEAIVREHALKLRSKLNVVVCGSYRRGAPTSGDVDVLICDLTGKVHHGLLPLLIDSLSNAAFLTDNLQISSKSVASDDPDSYMGVCQMPPCFDSAQCNCTHVDEVGLGTTKMHLHRRIDIKVYPKHMFPFAMLYFTGSDYFNRSMRLFCHKKGLSLSDKALVPVIRVSKDVVHEGPAIPCNSEEDIFAAIGLEYKEPSERNV